MTNLGTQPAFNFAVVDTEKRRGMLHKASRKCPLSRFIANEKAVNRLRRAAFAALGDEFHRIEQSFALLGPASTGKTTLAKLFAETVQLPFIEIHPKAVRTAAEMLEKINSILGDIKIVNEDGSDGDLSLVEQDNGKLIVPPCIIFIDEVHALNKGLVQSLLKATEPNDGIWDTGKWTVDCRNVCWMIATTDRGLLFGPFDTRFDKIHLELYTLEEIAKIIQQKNPDWSMEICRLVARYGGRIPREAQEFAKEMRLEEQMNPGKWEEIARRIATDRDIDEFGMTAQRLRVLRALANGPVSRDALCDSVPCQLEELERFIIPPLRAATADQAAMVTICSRGYMLTEAGDAELAKRAIKLQTV